jgi:glutamate N-acetyltransferase/amino-acid N-acetyltransferase
MISVDGDTSTNDMVIALANGMAQNTLIDCANADFEHFAEALNEINVFLAKKIAADGEGATKLLAVTVNGADSEADARKLARTVAASSLVKTAAFASDANWGRIVAALGYAGVGFDPECLSISFHSEHGAVKVMCDGQPIELDTAYAQHVLAASEVHICIELNAGAGQQTFSATAWGCDLSYDYVRINGTYRNYSPPAPATSLAEVG